MNVSGSKNRATSRRYREARFSMSRHSRGVHFQRHDVEI